MHAILHVTTKNYRFNKHSLAKEQPGHGPARLPQILWLRMRQMFNLGNLSIPAFVQCHLLQPLPSHEGCIQSDRVCGCQLRVFPRQRYPSYFSVAVRSGANDAVARSWFSRGDCSDCVQHIYPVGFLLQMECRRCVFNRLTRSLPDWRRVFFLGLQFGWPLSFPVHQSH